MPPVQRTAAARKDLADIFLCIADDDVDAARRLIRLIEQKILLLAQVPGTGRQRDELRAGMRSLSVGEYLIFYRSLPNGGIEVIRVVHGARDLRKIFRRKP